jgi:hypothetical protein
MTSRQIGLTAGRESLPIQNVLFRTRLRKRTLRNDDRKNGAKVFHETLHAESPEFCIFKLPRA